MRKLLFLGCLLLGTAHAFPTKPVRIIVAFPPGGGTDIVARLIALPLGEAWKQPVVVENRAGASGVIGTEAAARAEPDGHTLFMATMGNMTANQHLYPKMAVDPLRAFAPITKVVDVHFVFMANPALPADGVPELIALAKSKPGQIHYSSSGPGGAPHLAMELFKRQAGVDLTHVPYKGSGPGMTDLLGGRVMLTMDSLLQGLPHIRAGKLKGLAVTHAKRNPALPDVPTISEAGVKGGESGSWIALLAPAGTPQSIIEKLNSDVKAVVADPEVREKLIGQGAVPQSTTPAELQKLIDADLARYGKIIRDKGLKAE